MSLFRTLAWTATLAIAACSGADGSEAGTAAPTEQVAACGSDDLPDCPTQAFMKATMQAHLRTHDFARLAEAFDMLFEQAPPGYDEWRRIAADGARAARDRDATVVRTVCKRCHDSERDRFMKEWRRHRLFGPRRTADNLHSPS
jgi:hypothetical protein